MRRHWAINGRFLSQPLTGVQRYAREIVGALDTYLAEELSPAGDIEIELLMPPEATERLPLRAIKARVAGRFRGHLWEQYCLPGEVKGGLISLCNTGPLSVRKQILCIHDLNTRLYPASYSLAFRSLYRSLIPALGRTAARIGTVSHFSAAELARFGICPADKIFVAPNGHEHTRRWESGKLPAISVTPRQKTVVILGSQAPHKNAALIIGMAERLAAEGIEIAVVGMADGRVFSAGPKQQRAANVAWLGRLGDNEMAALLRDCLCLVFPSFVEGFGLPPLEAMALGCPVIVSDRTSLPEICGKAALYASPDDADAWFDRIIRLATSPELRARMIADGHQEVARYRWRESALRYLDVMDELDAAGKGNPAIMVPRSKVDTVRAEIPA